LEGEFHREKGQAVNCIQCRECEEKCPQGLPISEWMPVVHRVLGESVPYNEASQTFSGQELGRKRKEQAP